MLTEEQTKAEKRKLVVLYKGTSLESVYTENTIFTCDTCPSNDTCEWAFDGYNTNGDCLAEK